MTGIQYALLIFVAFGWLLATGIGLFRLLKNNLVGEERVIILLTTTSTGWLGISYWLYIFGLVPHLNELSLPARPILIAAIILLLLYYRKPKK